MSRSFYLSIRLLPAKLRDPVALAYLLARATDTIADTAQLDRVTRMAQLGTLARAIQGEPSEAIGTLISSFAPLQTEANERALIEQLPTCLQWLELLTPDDRRDVREVLARINEGQAFDVERFGDDTRVTAVANAAELDRYTYLVAGSVGEFWTTVSARHLPRFSVKPLDEMIRLGVEYGKGLQLLNILRDAGDDLRRGRCYLPADELHSLGLDPAVLQENPAAAEPVMETWRARADRGLQAGIEYAAVIRSSRVRLATALPALIGARTLSLLRETREESITRRIKVPRAEVRQMLFRIARCLASPRSIRTLFAELSA